MKFSLNNYPIFSSFKAKKGETLLGRKQKNPLALDHLHRKGHANLLLYRQLWDDLKKAL